VKIPGPGVFLSAPVLAEIAPRLLDLLEDQYRRDGVQMPEPVRQELQDAAEVGMKYRAYLAKGAGFRQNETLVDNPISSAPTLVLMTYSAKEVAAKRGRTVRAVQYCAKIGTLPAMKVDGVWRFDAVAVDREAAK